MKLSHRIRVATIAAGLCSSVLSLPAQAPQTDPHAFHLSGDYQRTHDPSIMKDGDTYYVFATGKAEHGQFPVRCSHDLENWKMCGQVFDDIPGWIKQTSPGTRELWAPDVSFYDGLYHLYYAYSLFGKNTSGIALATNKTLNPASPDYKWIDQGLVLKSTEQDDYNAIDPNLVIDAKGQTWLSFGSFWNGIKMRRIDRKTGKVSSADTKTYSIAARKRPANAPQEASVTSSTSAPAHASLPPDWEAIEAPFIIRHDKYYYLFVSWDLCCRGLKSTYRTMVGRAESVTGPYLDNTGTAMSDGGGSPLLAANAKWLGPGGESLLQLPGRDIIVFHAYDAQTGRPALQISTLGWKDGWPQAAMEGEVLEGAAMKGDAK